METVDDILREMRDGDWDCNLCDDECDCPNATRIMDKLADRLEKAHRSEIEAKDAEITKRHESQEGKGIRNIDKYKDSDEYEVSNAFERFCDMFNDCHDCPIDANKECKFAWLFLDVEKR